MINLSRITEEESQLDNTILDNTPLDKTHYSDISLDYSKSDFNLTQTSKTDVSFNFTKTDLDMNMLKSKDLVIKSGSDTLTYSIDTSISNTIDPKLKSSGISDYSVFSNDKSNLKNSTMSYTNSSQSQTLHDSTKLMKTIGINKLMKIKESTQEEDNEFDDEFRRDINDNIALDSNRNIDDDDNEYSQDFDESISMETSLDKSSKIGSSIKIKNILDEYT